jgi:surface-anchored protein
VEPLEERALLAVLAVLTTEHVDIGMAYEEDAWDLHVHDETNDAEYAPDEALLFVAPQALTTRPAGSAFDFIGVGAGESFYRLPHSPPNPESLLLGFGTEEIEDGTFLNDVVHLQLKAVNGPGHFSVWRSTDAGPELFMATSDGITASDLFTGLAGGHEDLNFGFTAQGPYEVTFEAVATLPDGTPTSSGDVTYFFAVDSTVAVDDAYTVNPGNSVFGNVLFNDIDAEGDPLTAAVATNPTKGTLVLNPDGTFTYTPGATFNGIDTFTYTADGGNGAADTATVTVNIGIAYEEDAWDLHVHDETNDAEYEPDEALLFVGPQALTTRPAGSSFDFIGVGAGQPFYRLPHSPPNPELLLLGFATEEIEDGTLLNDVVHLQLKAVNGPGHFSVWRSTDTGPELFMATSDGISASDLFTGLAGGHEDLNFGFTATGRYEVAFEAVATLPEGNVTASGDVTYFFSVDNTGKVQFDSSSYSVLEGGSMTVTIQRVGGADGPATVHFLATGITAAATDFAPFEGDVVFADGEVVKTLTFAAVQDSAVEAHETVGLALTVPESSAVTLGEPASAIVTILDDDSLRVVSIVVNNGETQRSNIETLSIQFSGPSNVQALIDNGHITRAVKLFRSNGHQVNLSAARFRYDAATFTLTIDVTKDGFGGSQSTLLKDGKYELRLDTQRIRAANNGPKLTDDDGENDRIYRSQFHRLEGDFNGDQKVRLRDIELFFSHFGAEEGSPRYDFAFDLTGRHDEPDGRIDWRDLLRLLTLYGNTV